MTQSYGPTHPCSWKQTLGFWHCPPHSLFKSLIKYIFLSLSPFTASAYVRSSSYLWVCLKRKNPNTYKEKKDTEHHLANKNSGVICVLPRPMITHDFLIIILPIFHTVQTTDLTFWVIHKVQSFPTHCENQQTFCWEPSCLFMYSERELQWRFIFCDLFCFRWNRWLSKVNICMRTVTCSCVSVWQCKGKHGHQYLSTNYFCGKIGKILI